MSGLSETAVTVLHVIRDSPRGELAGSQIRDALGTQVAGVLQQLEQERLIVRRHETDAEHAGARRRRYIYYRLNPQGLRAIADMGLTVTWTSTPPPDDGSCEDCGLDPDVHALCPHCTGDFGRGTEQRDRHAETCCAQVRCPKCGARPGQRCEGGPYTAPHLARENAARIAR